MGWTTGAICDRHWFEQNPDRRPRRTIGERAHCHIPGCDQTGDIFVRTFISDPTPSDQEDPEDVKPYKTNFSSDMHALATGALVGELSQIEHSLLEVGVDDEGNYTPTMKLTFYVGGVRVTMQLHTELLDED